MDENVARERRLLESANAHWGLLHYDDLLREGLTRGAIEARTEMSRLTRLYHHVYTPGHSVLRDEGRWLAALWTFDDKSVALAHWTAAAYHGWRRPAPAERLHVVTTRHLKSRDDIAVHRAGRMHRDDWLQDGLFRVTSIARTWVDLADVMTWSEYRGMADARRRLPIVDIRKAQKRHPFRPGAPLVRRLLEADDAHTKSEFERRFLEFSAANRLLRPSGLNAWVAGHKADCVYEEQKLVIELDGRAYHQRRGQMRADRQRDTDYQLAGYRILRLVWDDLHPDQAAETIERIVAMLALAGRP